MAVIGNRVIVQNGIPIPISLPFLKLRSNSKTINFQSNVHYHYNLPLTPFSCVAKSTAVSGGVSTTPTTTSGWSEFARNVSGEWDGFGADFTPQGSPIELPESVVPEAFREWEVKVYDWQTQCPTLAQPEDLLLTQKTIKLLPTVGCEADAATRYSIDERSVGSADNKVYAFAYQSNGCYVAVWPIEKQLEVEHCLINPQDRESRVRIIQVIQADNAKMILKNIRVFVEHWYGPFRDGDQLGGCAILNSAFASTGALEASQIVGHWQGSRGVANFCTSQTGFLQELKGNSVQKLVRDDRDLILLPKQLWCSLKVSKDGETCCEVGWLFDHGCAVTSRCIFSSNAKLKVS
ncbi:hypothetical protein GH714_027970 [Hevea brasiliensis]|uniref:Uncharacterized protein n=1 Tax=Hevea brasiliensis TaxID=3981 RepID=A0A6A6MRU6_HEVBR|nr:hypothetical protein GH714_027970 [Hevea brasiliensis]